MSQDRSYVVCGSKSWNRQVFDEKLLKLPGVWHFFGAKEELTQGALQTIHPRFIFFLHWSWIVQQDIIDTYECINFHMTDLPFGRGGSPLQNLILRGFTETKLTAHRMVQDLDAGPVYGKETLELSGTAEEILRRSSELAATMIESIVSKEPEPVPQIGEVTVFRRRKPEESAIPPLKTPKELYDFIRMLDAEGYPAAFFERNGFRYELRNARLDGETLSADITIHPSNHSDA